MSRFAVERSLRTRYGKGALLRYQEEAILYLNKYGMESKVVPGDAPPLLPAARLIVLQSKLPFSTHSASLNYTPHYIHTSSCPNGPCP